MLKSISILAVAGLFVPRAASAADFHCRNTQTEVLCEDGKCEAKPLGEFTSMDLTRTGNKLSLGVYESSWEGPILMGRTRGGMDFLYAKVAKVHQNPYEPRPAKPETMDLGVIYQPVDQVAVVYLGGAPNTMGCAGD